MKSRRSYSYRLLLYVPLFFVFFIIINFFLPVSISSGDQAPSSTFWGPEDFFRGTGEPKTEIRKISIEGFEAPFTFHLKNGDESGNNRVSSAHVWLNGKLLYSPSAFSQQISGYDIPVELTDPSKLEIKIDSIPGSKITVSIEGHPSGPPKILLEGDPSSPAIQAIYDFDAGDFTTDDEILLDSNGNRIDGSNIGLALQESATIGEVNALLEEIGGSIISMQESVGLLTVKIPVPENIDALGSIISNIEQNSIIHYAAVAYMPVLYRLPANIGELGNILFIDNQLAVKGPAAWNSSSLISQLSSPTLIIADAFGDGPPNSDDFNVQVNASDFGIGNKDSHGYGVLGVIAGRHSGPGELNERDFVTGIFPGTLKVRAVDFQKHPNNIFIIMAKLVELIKSTEGHIVVNTSFGLPGNPPEGEMKIYARWWLEKLRTTPLYATGKTDEEVSLENKFLHVTAAANSINAGSPRPARLSSPFTMARLDKNLTTYVTVDVPLSNLKNTLVIENRAYTSILPLEPACLNDSTYPGDLSAIGTGVYVFKYANEGTSFENGTSFATPQVAGLAAFVWGMQSNLKVEQLLNLLINTSEVLTTDASCPVKPAPVIDAYAAVLATDRKEALENGGLDIDAQVRLSTLDVDNNGKFDEDDITDFLAQFDYEPGRIDYSKFDLNGDGRTGGDTTAKFNLNIDNPPTYTTVNYTTNDGILRVNENKVTDQQVLCYYAYSNLYSGDSTARNVFLDGKCIAFDLEKINFYFENYVRAGGQPGYNNPHCGVEDDAVRDNITKFPGLGIFDDYTQNTALSVSNSMDGSYANDEVHVFHKLTLEGESLVFNEDLSAIGDAQSGMCEWDTTQHWEYCGLGQSSVGFGMTLYFSSDFPFDFQSSFDITSDNPLNPYNFQLLLYKKNGSYWDKVIWYYEGSNDNASVRFEKGEYRMYFKFGDGTKGVDDNNICAVVGQPPHNSKGKLSARLTPVRE